MASKILKNSKTSVYIHLCFLLIYFMTSYITAQHLKFIYLLPWLLVFLFIYLSIYLFNDRFNPFV